MTKWNEETLLAEMSKYSSKPEFMRGNPHAYRVAQKRHPGLAEQTLPGGRITHWTEEKMRFEANKWNGRTAFNRGNPSAHKIAIRRFPTILNEVYGPYGTDADAFYIWRVEGTLFNNNPVFKIGITSARLGMWRINQYAKLNGVRVAEAHLFHTEHASLIEQTFHETFTVIPTFGIGRGKTEFRSCDEQTFASLVRFAATLGTRMYTR